MMTSRCLVRLGADLLRVGESLRAQLGRHRAPLGLHAPVHRLAHLRRQLDPLQAHVDDLHADPLRVVLELLAHHLHDLVALARNHLVNGALAELLAQRRVDRLIQALDRKRLVAADADVVLLHVDDAPLHEGVHQHVLLLGGDEALGVRGVEGEDPRVEVADVLDQRQS